MGSYERNDFRAFWEKQEFFGAGCANRLFRNAKRFLNNDALLSSVLLGINLELLQIFK